MFDDIPMRTTLDLDEDVLQALKEIAAMKGQSAGRVASDLVRKALEPKRSARVRNGVPILHARPGQRLITTELINRVLDEE